MSKEVKPGQIWRTSSEILYIISKDGVTHNVILHSMIGSYDNRVGRRKGDDLEGWLQTAGEYVGEMKSFSKNIPFIGK